MEVRQPKLLILMLARVREKKTKSGVVSPIVGFGECARF